MSDAAVMDAPVQEAPQTQSRPDPAAGDLRGMDTAEFRERLDSAFKKIPDSKRASDRRQKSTPETKVETPKPEAAKPEAQKPEPVKAIEPTPEETAAAGELLDDDPKSQEAWEKYKKGYKLSQSQTKQIEEFRQKVETLSQEREEFERIKKEFDDNKRLLNDANGKLYMTMVEETPEWKEAVLVPGDQVIEGARYLSQRHSLDPEKVMEAVFNDSQGNSAGLEELISGLSDREKNRYYTLSQNIEKIEQRKAELRSDSRNAYETSMRKRQEEMQQKTESYHKEFDKAASAVGEKFEATVSKFLPEDHGLDFADIRNRAKDIEQWGAEEKALAGYAAWTLPSLISSLEKAHKRATEAEAQLSKYRNGSPKASGGAAPSAPGVSDKSKPDYAKMSGKEAARQSAARIRASVGL